MNTRKHFISCSAIALALTSGLAMTSAFADDGTTGPRDGSGPERVAPADGSVNTGMVGNRENVQTRDLERGGTDQKTQVILDSINQAPEKAGEKLFMLDAAMANQWEIDLSRLAENKASDPAVKDLAKQMVTQHEQAQQKLFGIARQMNVDLPDSLPQGKKNFLNALGSLPTDKFEACYLMVLKADHAKAITSFADHEVALQDQAVKGYITEVLPKLREHGQHVIQVASAKHIGSNEFAVGGRSDPAIGNIDQSEHRQMDRNQPTDVNTANPNNDRNGEAPR